MIVVWFSQSCDNCEVLFPSLALNSRSAAQWLHSLRPTASCWRWVASVPVTLSRGAQSWFDFSTPSLDMMTIKVVQSDWCVLACTVCTHVSVCLSVCMHVTTTPVRLEEYVGADPASTQTRTAIRLGKLFGPEVLEENTHRLGCLKHGIARVVVRDCILENQAHVVCKPLLR